MNSRHYALGVTAGLLALAACGQAAEEAAPAATPSETATAAPEAAAGDGDGQGDALVPGTNYNATAKIPCAGYNGAAAGMCDAGVIRGGETATFVEVMLSDGTKRIIFFNPDGSFLSFNTAEADGTAAMKISSERKGDVTIAKIGTETYEVPDVFVIGD
ncbi:MAG: hypothetical protein ACOVQY_03220 [Erythrobacter sp.]|jgi:hypothetical protein